MDAPHLGILSFRDGACELPLGILLARHFQLLPQNSTSSQLGLSLFVTSDLCLAEGNRTVGRCLVRSRRRWSCRFRLPQYNAAALAAGPWLLAGPTIVRVSRRRANAKIVARVWRLGRRSGQRSIA